ncbi:AMP-binding protein [Rubritalea spongiae]|uniref:AMP-binding protein n=1 Tax=Rubritalea spongiae TaxID=430797 RepID=A0ABW5E4Z6_9BACT
MNLVEKLRERAELHPSRTALIDSQTNISYDTLYQKVCSGSQILQSNGLKQGDRVLILIPVSIDLYIAFLSILHAGLTVILLDPSADKNSIKLNLENTPAHACIGIAKAQLLRITHAPIRSIPLHFCNNRLLPFTKVWHPRPNKKFLPKLVEQNHPALITFTSGSTGRPKVACRSHGFLLAQHTELAESLNLRESETDLITLPVFAIANLASGLTSVIANTNLAKPGSVDADAINQQVRKHSITRCSASPAFFQSLLKQQKLPAFKQLYTGGAPVFPHFLAELQSELPESTITIVYGSTEAEPISHQVWSETSAAQRHTMQNGRGLLVGKPSRGTRLKIIKDSTGHSIPPLTYKKFEMMECKVGETGELVVSGEHVLKSYLNNELNSETKFSVDGEIWHRTGDAACIQNDQTIWLQGRCKAAFQSQGSTIYPFGIECSAMFDPRIERCALVKKNGKITLTYQGQLNENHQKSLLSTLSLFGVEQLLQLNKIPVDKRHNAKIDYPALESVIADIPDKDLTHL